MPLSMGPSRLGALLAFLSLAQAFNRIPGLPSRGTGLSRRAETTRIALERFETSLCFLLLPAISVITFYEASNTLDMDRAVSELKLRLDNVLAENPWLLGNLEKAPRGQKHHFDISFPSKIALKAFTYVDQPADFHANSHWETIASATTEYVVRIGRECVGTQEPLFRVTAIPLACPARQADNSNNCEATKKGDSQFAVVVSLSHVLGDGASLYQIQGMLSKKGQVAALSATRKVYNRPTWEAWCSSRVLTGCFARTVFGPRKRVTWSRVNRSWIDAQKSEALNHAAAAAAAQSPSPKSNEGLWVSTNDVLTSYLIKAGNFGRAYMAVDLRGRLGNSLTSLDIGNYESAVTLPSSECACNPFAVRRCLSEFDRTRKDPFALSNHLLACLAARQLFVTNWATVYSPMDITNSRRVLHLPLLDPTAGQRGTAIIFSPEDNQIAVLIADSNATAREDIVLGLPN